MVRKLAWFACAFVSAAACCVYLLPPLPVWLGVAVILVGLLLFCLRKRILRRMIALLLGIGFGLSWTAGYYNLCLAPATSLQGVTDTITGEVSSYAIPARFGYKIDLELQYHGQVYPTLLYLEGDAATLVPGDRLTLPAKLEAVGCTYSPEEDLYHRSKGYVLLAYSQGDWMVEPCEQLPVKYLPIWAAKQLQGQIDELFPVDTVPFMKALLTGDRSDFDYGTRNALSLAGISHVVAISGMHVSILLGAVLLLLPNRRLAAAVGIPLVLFFTLLTGAPPSVVRAAVMQILLLLAPQLYREVDMPTSLAAAMLVILLGNPWAVADPGFQLSFAAMAGMLLFSSKIMGPVNTWLEEHKPPVLLRGLLGAVALSVATTVGASIFTVPLVACHFGVVSLLAAVTNLLTLWAVSLCFQLGMLVCLLGFVLPTAAGFLAGLLAWLVRYILAVAHGIAGLPFAAVYTDSAYTTILLVFFYILLVTFLCLREGRKPLAMLACMLFGLCFCVGLSLWESRRAELQTTVLDVGQGQCVLLEWDGLTTMIDCGGSYPEEAGELASRLLLSHGRTQLDVLVLTHFDADHAGGIPHLLSRVGVGALYVPPVEADNALYLEICSAARQEDVPIQTVSRDVLLSDGDTALQIFAPVSYEPGNDGGLAVLCSNEDYDMIITGDMSTEAEHRLLMLHRLPDAEILLAGHHGSADSTGEELLRTVAPDMVVFSVGSGNRYGHPTPAALNRVEKTGAMICRTDLHSTVTIRR